MQATRRVMNAVTPKWHSMFHKSDQLKTNCACVNHGALWITDTLYCLTRRWSGARGEFDQVVTRVRNFDITLGDVWRSTMLFIQLGLIFNVGAGIGRGAFTGYYYGPALEDVWGEKEAHH